LSYPWDAVVIIALFATLACVLVILISKYNESRVLVRRVAELRSIILDSEGRYLGRVKHDKNGGHTGRLILPSGGELPILIWHVPGVGSKGNVSQDLISEPVILVRSEESTPEPGADESGGSEFTGGLPAFPRPKFSLRDIANAVYSGSYSPPAVQKLPNISEERWDELRDRLRRLRGLREGSKFGRSVIKSKLGGSRPVKTTPEWTRRRLLGIMNSRTRLM